MKFSKRGQSSTNGGFVLIMIVMALLALYILMLPAQDQEDLLGIDLDSGDNDGSDGDIDDKEGKEKSKIFELSNLYISEEGPEDDDFTIMLPEFELTNQIEHNFIELNPIKITRSIFFNNNKEIIFDVEDLDTLDDLNLIFSVGITRGNLKIKINEILIYEVEEKDFEFSKNIKPISITKNLLKEKGNKLTFETNSPGIFFWKVNKYELKNIKINIDKEITLDRTDLTFKLSDKQISQLDNIRFQYALISQNTNGLEMFYNRKTLFSGEPIAQGISKHQLSLSDLREQNTINIVSNPSKNGRYIFTDVKIIGEYKTNEDQKYYFNLDDVDGEYYLQIETDTLGQNSNVIIYINGEPYTISTKIGSDEFEITDSLEDGRNEMSFYSNSNVILKKVRINRYED